MSDNKKKRGVEGYEIIQAVQIGDKEVVFGENEKAELPYFCGFYRSNDIVGEYSECMAGDDYVEMMELFAERVKQQCTQVREEQEKVSVPREKITEQLCIPLFRCENLEGRIMAVRLEILRPEYRSCEHQLIYVTGGNGARSGALGTACFGINVYSGEHCRWERYDFTGEVKPECLPQWAKEKVMELQQKESKEKEGVEKELQKTEHKTSRKQERER
jgi:hypothetical protein